MQRLGLVLLFILASVPLPLLPEQGAAAAQKFPWISPFEEGRYIGELLPSAVSETDFQQLGHSLAGKEVTLIILDAGGGSFESAAVGFYDEKKRDVIPLWSSAARDELPVVFDGVAFDDLFIRYGYLPGDKYVSSNFKVAVSASYGSHNSNIKVFTVDEDMDYAGASLKTGDFLLAGDSGGGGALSNRCDGDYSDIVFVLRLTPAPPVPMTAAFWILGSGGILGLTWWGFRKGKQGLDA